MRKVKYLLAVGVMSASLLFGCGSNDKAISADEFIEKVEKCETEIKSFDMKMNVSLDMKMSDDADSSVKGKLSLNGSFDNNKNMKFDMMLDAGEEIGKQNITAYFESKGDKYNMYMQLMGQWFKMSSDEMSSLTGEAIPEVNVSESNNFNIKEILPYIKDANVTNADGTYTLSGTVDIKKLYEMMDSIDLAGLDLSEFKEQFAPLVDKIKMDVSLSIDENGLVKAFDLSVGKFEHEGVTLNALSISINASNFNKVADIVIPDEANNASDISTLFDSLMPSFDYEENGGELSIDEDAFDINFDDEN